MLNESFSPSASTRGHRVRELVCAYRSLRDNDGRVVDVPTCAEGPSNRGGGPRTADRRSARRGLRRRVSLHQASSAGLACALARDASQHTRVDAGRVRARVSYTRPTGVMVVHNHPSGNPTPSPDDARLTLRLCAAADVLDLPLLDHLIVGDEHGISASARPVRWEPLPQAGDDGHAAASTCEFCGSARPRQGFARCARRWRGLDSDLRTSHGGHLSKRRGISKNEEGEHE